MSVHISSVYHVLFAICNLVGVYIDAQHLTEAATRFYHA